MPRGYQNAMLPRMYIRPWCYQTFVRPIVEYASTVWDRSTEKYIKSEEKVQWHAAHFVKSDYRRRSSVTTMLESLNLVSLVSRRAGAKLVMLYRITNNLMSEKALNFHIWTKAWNLAQMTSMPYYFRILMEATWDFDASTIFSIFKMAAIEKKKLAFP